MLNRSSNQPISTNIILTQVDLDGRLQKALAGGVSKAAVENELLGDLEQSGNLIIILFKPIYL